MPKAPMDEHGDAMAGQDKIRATGQVARLEPKADPGGMEPPPHLPLRTGIPTPVPLHDLPSRGGDRRLGTHHDPNYARPGWRMSPEAEERPKVRERHEPDVLGWVMSHVPYNIASSVRLRGCRSEPSQAFRLMGARP